MTGTLVFEPASMRRRLCSVPFLRALDGSSLDALEAELEWLSVPGGWTLFDQNDVADAVYFVIAGCLGVIVQSSDGREHLVARAQSGESVGEMALLGGQTRSATVVAIRDSEVLRLGRASYERLLQQHPRSMLSLVSLLVRRLRDTTRRDAPAETGRTLALVPMSPDVGHIRFALALADELATVGRRVRLLDSRAAVNTTEWFNAVESAHDLVLYHADPSDSFWTRFCLRQADRVLLIASPDAPFRAPAWLSGQGKSRREPFDLALLHESFSSAGNAAESWRKELPVDLICQVRHGNAGDIARVARLLTGKAIGLVLGCGGARGFAHLGVIRALREANIPIDLIGGCSMGAIVGAAVALEWDDAQIGERLRHAFVESNPMNDYTLPFLALVKGRKVSRRLEEHFGGVRIEDLWRPFFCVSTNLSAAKLTVHRDGPLTLALRASVSIPGLLPPVAVGGETHVDGGLMNCLPVDVMKSLRRGPVIAVDVASDRALGSLSSDHGRSFWQFLRSGRKTLPIVDVLVRAGTVSSDALTRMEGGQADILFKPPLETVDLLDWKACTSAIDAGYRHAIDKLEHLDKSDFAAIA
jgi:NTE family protein